MKINELFLIKRTCLKLTQQDLGKKFGCTQAAISFIERGLTKSLSFEQIEWLFEDEVKDESEYLIERVEYLEDKVEEIKGFLNI